MRTIIKLNSRKWQALGLTRGIQHFALLLVLVVRSLHDKAQGHTAGWLPSESRHWSDAGLGLHYGWVSGAPETSRTFFGVGSGTIAATNSVV